MEYCTCDYTHALRLARVKQKEWSKTYLMQLSVILNRKAMEERVSMNT